MPENERSRTITPKHETIRGPQKQDKRDENESKFEFESPREKTPGDRDGNESELELSPSTAVDDNVDVAERRRHEAHLRRLREFVLPPRPECPICALPMPLDEMGYLPCCGTLICGGCDFDRIRVVAGVSRGDEKEMRGIPDVFHRQCCHGCSKCKKKWKDGMRCMFCRALKPLSVAKGISCYHKRANAGDANAMTILALMYEHGPAGLVKQDVGKALAFYNRAADLGSLDAMHNLGRIYHEGNAIVEQDKDRAMEFLETAAEGGNVYAWYSLGEYYLERSRRAAGFRMKMDVEIAMAHFCVAGTAGMQEALDQLRGGYKENHLTKEDFCKVLRSFQSAREEMDSESRRAKRVMQDEYMQRAKARGLDLEALVFQ